MQQQAPYPPPTPTSAQVLPNGQWPQNAQYPHYQQASQSGYAGQYPQYSYTPTPQHPAPYYGSQPPSQMSPIGHQGSPVQMQQHQVTQAPSYSNIAPQLTQSSAAAQYPQHPYNQGNAPANMYPSLQPSNTATNSLSSTPMQQSAPVLSEKPEEPEELEEPEEDDLRQLHVPALPTVEGNHKAYPRTDTRRRLT